MTVNANRGSAKIYEFPARGRFAQNDRVESDGAAANSMTLPRAARLVSGGAWYHDEAIQQAEKTRRG